MRATGVRTLAAVVAVALGAMIAPATASAVTFTVTSDDDAGAGTLRAAIAGANANGNPGGADAIHFDDPVLDIILDSELPSITEPLTIDGCSGAGPFVFEPCVAVRPGAGVVGDFDGLLVGSEGTIIDRIALSDFDSGIVQLLGGEGMLVRRTWIGARHGPFGSTIVGGNETGVVLAGASAQIGGSGFEGNVIVDSDFSGVHINAASDASVTANLIGVLRDGSAAGNEVGILSNKIAASDNVLGGDTDAEANLISSSGSAAIGLVNSDRNYVLRNTGQGNSGPFIDLGTDGPGNDPGTGANDGIQAPVITAATNASVSGGGARPLATVRVYRRSVDDPGRIDAFVEQTTANIAGNWQASFAALPGSGNLIATQTTFAAGTSELSTAISYQAPPPAVAAPPPTTTLPPMTVGDDSCSKLRKKLRKAKRQDKDKKVRKLRRKLRRLGCRR